MTTISSKNSPKNSSTKYIEAVGRRKTSIARVRLFVGTTLREVNGRTVASYFPTAHLQEKALGALEKRDGTKTFGVSVRVAGGGPHGQAVAVQHGIARALVKFDADLRPVLKQAGFLRRDPRAKERKKFGLKKARRAPQWSKR